MFLVRSVLESGKKIRVFNFHWGGGREGGILCKVRFGLWKENYEFSIFRGGRVFWVRSDLDSGKKIMSFQFSGGEGILGKVRFGIWKENLEFSILGGWGWGVFWVRSDLDSGKKIRVFDWGGVLGKVSFGIWKEN